MLMSVLRTQGLLLVRREGVREVSSFQRVVCTGFNGVGT